MIWFGKRSVAAGGLSGTHVDDVVCERILVDVGRNDIKGDCVAGGAIGRAGRVCFVDVGVELVENDLVFGSEECRVVSCEAGAHGCGDCAGLGRDR